MDKQKDIDWNSLSSWWNKKQKWFSLFTAIGSGGWIFKRKFDRSLKPRKWQNQPHCQFINRKDLHGFILVKPNKNQFGISTFLLKMFLIILEYTFSCCNFCSKLLTVWQILNEFKTSLNLTVALHSNSCLLTWNCVKTWHTFCKFWHFISSKNFWFFKIAYQFHLTFHYWTITSRNLRHWG